MKVDLFQTIIAIAIGALISYGFSIFNENYNNMIFGLGNFVIFSTSLIFLLGTNFEFTNSGTKVRVVSGVFFVLAMISSLVFTFINFTVLSLVITNAIIFLVYILVMYSLFTKKNSPL